MKILLLGEFSALHKNLKEGLVELGHQVTIASTGDVFKNIERDIDLSCEGNFISRKIKKAIKLFRLVEEAKNYDIVQLINPFVFYNKFFPNYLFYKKLIKNCKKFFVLAAGDDAFFWKYGREKLKYGPFDDSLKYDYKKKSFFMESKKMFKFNNFLIKSCDGVIPIMYEYYISYYGNNKLRNTIPIPMNTKKIKYTPNIVKGKLIVFHGLNRYGFKGTKYVEEAFRILSEKYPDDLELIIDGHMPLDKYLKLMDKTNIVIDQTNSHSLGVNGIYALAMGKIVLGGAEPESLKVLGLDTSPVINVRPDADSIVEEIEKLLEKRDDFEDMGYNSREFVENTHGYVDIAKKYLELWSGCK